MCPQRILYVCVCVCVCCAQKTEKGAEREGERAKAGEGKREGGKERERKRKREREREKRFFVPERQHRVSDTTETLANTHMHTSMCEDTWDELKRDKRSSGWKQSPKEQKHDGAFVFNHNIEMCLRT